MGEVGWLWSLLNIYGIILIRKTTAGSKVDTGDDMFFFAEFLMYVCTELRTGYKYSCNPEDSNNR